jgi:tRNA(Ile)-lysidine synthetase-like protein
VIGALFPGFRAQLPAVQEWAGLREDFTARLLEPFLADGLRESPGLRELDWRAFEAQHGAAFLPLLVQAAVRRWGLHGHEAARAAELASAQAGRQVQTRAGLIVRGRHGLLCYAEAPQAAAGLPVEIGPEALPLRLEHAAWTLELSRAAAPARFGGADLYLSEERIEWPLTLRSPQPGDRFRPFGMRGFKLVSDFLTDLKAAPADKAACLVLLSGAEIAALPGLRIDDRFRLEDPERPALLLRFTRK